MTYSLVKIIGFANANVCCNNKLLGYSSSLQSSIIKSSLGGSCVLPMDPEHKLKKKLKKKLKNSSKKLKTQAKNSKSRHFLDRCMPEMRSKRKPDLESKEFSWSVNVLSYFSKRFTTSSKVLQLILARYLQSWHGLLYIVHAHLYRWRESSGKKERKLK